MSSHFSFHRGSLALDFAGTVGRRTGQPEERLPDGAALTTWLREAASTGAGDENRLDAGGRIARHSVLAGDAAATSADLAVARGLREAIARIGAALVDGQRPRRDDIALVNQAAQWATRVRPVLDPRTLALGWEGRRGVRAALGRVAADAIELFATRRERLVRCELRGCGALLLSASRGPARRWCSMQTCGNVAKVAAHRARARAAAAG